MLGKLFGSNARVKILKLFLSHPNESFYIRQLSRNLSLQLNSVRRELENLEKFGLLISGSDPIENQEEENIIVDVKPTKGKKKKKEPVENKTDKKYYRVDTDFVLYNEIKELMMKAQILYERDFVDKIQKIGSIKLLILTGFFENIENSVVDILIVGRLSKDKFIKIIKDLEIELGREINYTIMDTREYKYRRDITDVFLYGILEGKKTVILDVLGMA